MPDAMSLVRPLVVAIPVRDEAERIVACLDALAGQRGAAVDHVVLLLNNCTDATATIVRDMQGRLPFGVTLAERAYAAERAHAGTARREAMEIAAAIAGPDGILLTTDADGRVQPHWAAGNLAAIAAGAAVVCGRAEIDPVEALAIPQHLHADDAMETEYATLLDRIHDLVDPDPHDPWPRHTEHSGASIAVTVAVWGAAGGVPALSSGEDRGFLSALRRIDAPIRHAPDVAVTVSGRTLGRAPGGMAETMARRMIRQDECLDDSLEAADDCYRRASLRARLRLLFDGARNGGNDPRWRNEVGALSREAGLPAAIVTSWLRLPHFGEAWARLERESPVLVRRPVLRADCATEANAARRIIAGLRVTTTQPVEMQAQPLGPPALQTVLVSS